MKLSTRTICYIGLFTAMTAVLSILVIPTPWGVPFTLQTFAMALVGYVLGRKFGTISTALYVLLGFIGVPVYAGMSAGPAVLAGPTGGYIIGFIVMTFFCGIAFDRPKGKISGIRLVVFSILGLASCHVLGSIWLKTVTKMTLLAAFSVGSIPYLAKDILSVVAAYVVAVALKKALQAANIAGSDAIV